MSKILLILAILVCNSIPFSFGQSCEESVELTRKFRADGDYSNALQNGLESLKQCEKELGKEHEYYLISLTELGLLYVDLGSYEKALPTFRDLVSLSERKFGKEHEGYITSLNNLALAYSYLGDYDQALPLLKELVSMIEKSGNDNPDFAICRATFQFGNLRLLYTDLFTQLFLCNVS